VREAVGDGEMTTKKELIEHYESCDIHKFVQIDGWYIPELNDSVMIPDQSGDYIVMCETEELRHSPSDLAVRVQIHKGTQKVDAIRILTKTIEWLSESQLLDSCLKGESK
jgi:hypothetical protein